MFGAEFSGQSVPFAPVPLQQRVVQPPPPQRVVEGAHRATLQSQDFGTMYARMPSPLQQLSESARQFADILESTGNVMVASSVSGFRVGHVDVYA